MKNKFKKKPFEIIKRKKANSRYNYSTWKLLKKMKKLLKMKTKNLEREWNEKQIKISSVEKNKRRERVEKNI